MGLFVSLAKGPIALLRSVTFPIRLADFKVSNHSPLVIPSEAEGSAVRFAWV